MGIGTPRRTLVLGTLGLLLLLDIGRSIYARVGYAHSTEYWQPSPKTYANLTWPPGADVRPNALPGERVYARYCATCHGPDGRGNGPAAPSLIPRPRDFTLGQFKYKSTPAGQPPTDTDMERVVAGGLRASAMPYFNDILSQEEIRQVVAYIKPMSGAYANTIARPVTSVAAVTAVPRVRADSGSIARGRSLYQTQGCASCHGIDGRSRLTLADAKGYPVIARDLTAPWTFRGGDQPEQIWMRLTTGLSPGPMPAFAATMTPQERWDVVNYVLSLARVAPWEPGGKLDGPGHHGDRRKRGEYLVRAEMCGLCHTQINQTGIYRGDDGYLSGGMRIGAYPQGVFVSRNLTSDRETGLGAWTEAQIANAIRNGRAPDRTLNIWGMPWMYLHRLTQDDALAIASYLKTLPAVRNRIPPPLHYGLVETIVVKVSRGLPRAGPVLLSYADGNFADNRSGLSRDLPQRLLIWAQWLVLLVGIVLFVLAAPREHRFPLGARAWRRVISIALASVVLFLAGWMVYRLPALGVIPPDKIADNVSGSIPVVERARLASPEQTALAERGRYIFSVSSCALCHDNDGGGGKKLSWRPFGTLWARNISSDPQTGIGRWSDAEIARAIRSGISPDGRALHWQGMIWDHASNWDEEDVRAVVTYLRQLPPVRRAVPATRPPAADDCAVYSFWIAKSATAGCRT
jgi:mono/diheme cytochrome c family protein